MWDDLVDILRTKGIDYAELKYALVPHLKRRSVGLVFDSAQVPSGAYGNAVHAAVLPLLRRGSHSVLSGDIAEHAQGQSFIRNALASELFAANPYKYEHSSQFYVLFLNNLTDGDVENLRAHLRRFPFFVGDVDTCCSSPLRLMFAASLAPSYLLHRGTAILGHEEGDRHSPDNNYRGLPFERTSTPFRSLDGILFDTFLTHRIGRPLHPRELSTEIELAAIANDSSGLHAAKVVLDTSKLGYLLSHKAESFRRAGLSHVTPDTLSEIVRSQLRQHHVFNLRFEHDKSLFNILVEVPLNARCHRFMVGLEFLSATGDVRVVTMY